MLCCLESGSRYAPLDTEGNAIGNGWNSFPGYRRGEPALSNDSRGLGRGETSASGLQLVRTEGNALIEFDPSKMPQRVLVTVPEGVSAGESIQVQATDGSGRCVSAVVPPGMMPGSQFVVEFPPLSQKEAQHTPLAVPINGKCEMTKQPAITSGSFPQKVLVSVPEGISAGQEIYVTSPDGSGQTIAAKVPPGLEPGSSFFVEFPPSGSNHAANEPTDLMLFPEPASSPTAEASGGETDGNTILVKVPPGVPPGATIQVQVPDQPGRVIAAEVPPNVTEFRVAVPSATKEK